MAESDVVPLLARMFPSFRGVAPEESQRRAESLGLFACKAWSAGPQAMQGRGIPVPPEVHGRLAPLAGQALQAGRGGVAFIAHLRQGLGNDQAFVQIMTGLARVFAEAARGGGAPAPAPTPTPTPTAATAPAPAPAAPAPQDFGGLDLMPEEPTPARDMAYGNLELLPQDPASAPAPAPPAPAAAPPAAAPPPAGDFGGLDLAPDEDEGRPSAVELLYGGDPTAGAGEGAPQDPAERAFWLFERTGDPSHLQEAQAALQQSLQQAPHATAAAIAEAGLAKVAMLSGNEEAALRLSKSALARDPANLFAIEVSVRAQRGEAKRAPFLQALRQLTAALDSRDMQRIQQASQAMMQRFPAEPFGPLALTFAANMAQNDAAFERYLGQAWKAYPSQAYPDCTFGGEVDADLADVLIHYGRKPYKHYDEEGLRQTVENVDSKDNLIAGSLRMAVGIATVALTASGLQRPLERRLHFSRGRGMMGLQYFQQAPDVMGKAMMIGPTPEEAKAISDERIKCQALWRAFDKPGIKAQSQRYQCIGAEGVSALLRKRLEEIQADLEARRDEIHAKGPQLFERAQKDGALRAEIAQAAVACGAVDPLEAIKELDQEMAQIQSGAKKEAKKTSGGFFGKLKAAAVDAAKGVSDRIKLPQLKTKREQAVKELVLTIGRDLSDHTFQHPMLAGLVRQGAAADAFVDYLVDEEKRCQKEITALAGG